MNDDVGLVIQAQGGDRRAFTRLLQTHDDHMRGLAWQLLRDHDARDDVLQEAYLKAYRALPRFRAEAKFSTWLYRIVYRTCLDHLRRTRTVVPLDDAHDAADWRPDPSQVAADRSLIDAALASLPEDQRAAVLLVDADGLSYDEAAVVLDIAPGTVASRLSRARTTIRRTLGDRFEGGADR